MNFEGIVYEIIFRNDENGYTIAILDVDDIPLTIVGYMPTITIGQNLLVTGNIIEHKIYGEQLNVKEYRVVPNKSEKGIVKYLSSGIIKGVGEKTAQIIVEYLGKETLDIIHYNPERLKEIPGIGKKTAKNIVESLKEDGELREILIYLQNFDISLKLATKIYNKYGSETLKIINENPYMLSEEVRGIGFLKADEIAKSMGIESCSLYRIKSGTIFTLNKFASKGHTYVPKEELIEELKYLLQINLESINMGIESLIKEGKIHIENSKSGIRIYSKLYYNCESGIAKKLIRIAISKKEDIDIDIKKRIEEIEEETKIKFALKQKVAIAESIENGVNVITGGPGTGKTTTINTIIKIFEEQELKVLLAAPTGRAAKRMSEATNREAKTIHRLLEYSYSESESVMFFGKNEEDKLEADLIILDEMSMVDVILMNSLLNAVDSKSRLILVGDIDQLPSIGAGNVLRDIINSQTINVVKLDEIFRQAKESMIVVNAHRINKGEMPLVNYKDKDFFFLKEEEKDISEKILELVKYRLPKFNQYDSFTDIQILTCCRRGKLGVINLNKILQEGLNPNKGSNLEIKVGNNIYRLGDKIMQIKNNYNTEWKIRENGKIVQEGSGVFNGDMGFICDIDKQERELVVLFDDEKEVKYSFDKLEEITLSYATTIHKSQGSEFPVVVIPITSNPPMLMTRNILYTAITRAKEMVILIGIPYFMKRMIDNNNISKRYSALDEKLSIINEYREEE